MSGLLFDSINFVVGVACGMGVVFRFFDRVSLVAISQVNVLRGPVL